MYVKGGAFEDVVGEKLVWPSLWSVRAFPGQCRFALLYFAERINTYDHGLLDKISQREQRGEV